MNGTDIRKATPRVDDGKWGSRFSLEKEKTCILFICLTTQGIKRVMLGDDTFVYEPIIQEEIIYRLLVGDQGTRLRQMASAGSQSQQIARAIDWLKSNFTEPLRVDDLATQVNMSTSTFHHHFRELTAMSPLQYQKWLRLTEARRLMFAEDHDAATAAFQVGYESPSPFSREYNRMFGNSPLRDVMNLRQMAVNEVT